MGKYDSRIFAAGGLGSISGTVGTLPAGAELGEERWDNGIKYRLCCNASLGTATNPGNVLSAVPSAVVGAGNGPWSMTMTTVTGALNGNLAAVCHNATVATGYYFWGATYGFLASGVVMSDVSASTGNGLGVGIGGAFSGLTTTTLAQRAVAFNLTGSMTTTHTAPTRIGSVMLAIEGF